jgi:uncharacterized protein YrzB (UPF0473 family)
MKRRMIMNKKFDEENCGCDHPEHSHDCGCEHDDDTDIIYITLDDGSEIECSIIRIFEVDGKEYIALLSIDDDQVLLYNYEENEDGFGLSSIEDEDEFESVSEAFYTFYADEEGDYEDYGEYDEDDDEDEDDEDDEDYDE